jgi:hypothetical protein
MGDATLLTLTTIVMIIALALAFIPIMPGPAMIWAVALIFGAFNEFQRLTPVAAIVLTVLMIAASGSDFWLPLFGIKSGTASCLSTVGAFIGGLIGTFAIPLPVIGTLIGMIIGALLVEFIRLRDAPRALRAGRSAFNIFMLSYLVQLIAGFLMFGVYMVSLVTTG